MERKIKISKLRNMKNIILLLFISNIAFAQTKGYVLVSSDGYIMTPVNVDATLTGDGTSASPLSVVPGGTTPISVAHLASNATSNSTTTGVEITGINTTVGTGTYIFTYYIRYRSGATSTGIRFGVNHTGTSSVFMANLRLQESTTAASTGAASQAATGTQLKLVSGSSTRTESTTAPNLNLSISVDEANSDMFAIIEGLIVVTGAGDLELWHASEVAAASTVMAGTSLVLIKTN